MQEAFAPVESKAEVYLKAVVIASGMAEGITLPKGVGLFGQKPVAPPVDIAPLQQDINALSTRIRINEERFNDLRRKLQFLEQQAMSNQKKLNAEFKLMQGDVLEAKRRAGELENKVVMLIKELQLTSKKQDVDVLRRYLDMWDPVKFMTENQVKQILRRELENMKEQRSESD